VEYSKGLRELFGVLIAVQSILQEEPQSAIEKGWTDSFTGMISAFSPLTTSRHIPLSLLAGIEKRLKKTLRKQPGGSPSTAWTDARYLLI
jgi:hypothetical protein